METRRLEYFVALTAERNFARAAEWLHITQSALSQQIQRLEKDVGAQLIDRSVVPFRVTVAGERVLERARRVLREVEELAEVTEDVRGGRVGRVRIGVVHSLLYSQVPAAIQQFRIRHPGVEVDLRISPTGELYDALRLGQIEAAFVYTRPDDDDLHTDEIYEDPYVIVLPSAHRLAGADGLHLRQLRRERLLLSPRRHSTEAYDAILGACVNSGFSAHDITVERSSYTDQLGLVAAGMGVSLLPRRLAVLHVPGVSMVPLLSPSLDSRLLIARHPDVIDSTRDRFALEVTRTLTGSESA